MRALKFILMSPNLFPSHQHSPGSLPNHWYSISAEVAGTAASNVDKLTLFNISYALDVHFLPSNWKWYSQDHHYSCSPLPHTDKACPLTQTKLVKFSLFPLVRMCLLPLLSLPSWLPLLWIHPWCVQTTTTADMPRHGQNLQWTHSLTSAMLLISSGTSFSYSHTTSFVYYYWWFK